MTMRAYEWGFRGISLSRGTKAFSRLGVFLAAVALSVSASRCAQAAPIFYGDFTGATVLYNDVTDWSTALGGS
jgi:hypothetical protein